MSNIDLFASRKRNAKDAKLWIKRLLGKSTWHIERSDIRDNYRLRLASIHIPVRVKLTQQQLISKAKFPIRRAAEIMPFLTACNRREEFWPAFKLMGHW
jgi:hypothetical protein